jgi:hypothetical protein
MIDHRQRHAGKGKNGGGGDETEGHVVHVVYITFRLYWYSIDACKSMGYIGLTSYIIYKSNI